MREEREYITLFVCVCVCVFVFVYVRVYLSASWYLCPPEIFETSVHRNLCGLGGLDQSDHTHAHTHTRAHAHTRTYTRAHTHTHGIAVLINRIACL